MMWFLPLLHILAHFGPVSSDSKQGEIILRSKNNACEGYVEAYYDGEKGYIGDKHWSHKTEEVVCRSTHCGQPIVGTENVYRPLKSKVWLNELNCNGNEESLWECGGWPGPEISFYKKPTVKKIKCSNKISFHLKQHKCEGAVQYTIQSDDKNKEDGYICSKGFGDDEARVLCKSLGCGGFVKLIKSEWMRDDKFKDAKKAMINCGNIKDVDHLWQCVKSKPFQCDLPASVRCEGHTRVQLIGDASNVCSGELQRVDGKSTDINKTDSDWCKKLHCGSSEAGKQSNGSHHLRCTDKVQVVLTDSPNRETKCYGEVKIKVNNEHKSVCGNEWNDKASEMVCKELKCGEVIDQKSKSSFSSSSTGIINHVTCEGHESSLWYCRAEHRQQRCDSVPYVVCSESLELRLEDGPGRCAGRLEVKVEGEWKRVSKDGWTDSYTKLACNQLKCGDNGKVKSGEFSEGTEDFLKFTCGDNAKKLSNCKRERNGNQGGKPVELVCNENKVLFLEGNKSCSGLVGIEHGEKSYWLSGSEEMWNKTLADKVCEQMHCGEALNISRSPSEGKPIWNWTLSCSPDQKSIFDCNKTEIHPSHHNQTIAYVKCKGSITVSLTNNCWGTVIISATGTTGAVSDLHWSENLSKKLCEEKGCGTGVLKPLRNSQKSQQIIFKSLHATKQSTNISQYSIVKMEKSVPTRNLKEAYVVCTGSLKSRFNSYRHKCSGNVEVFYDGQWLPVRKDALDENAQNAICKELNCGQALEKNTYFGPRSTASNIVKVSSCSGSEIAKCQNITLEENRNTELGSLQCSNWRTVALEVENACKGEVVVYSDGGLEPKRSFISSKGWTKAEGEKLCDAMNCGNFLSISNSTEPPEANDWWEGTFNCTSASTDIWDCENKIQANAIQKTKLFIECKGEPVVKLSQNCSGDLTINNVPVCSSQWKTDYSHRVCQQLGCGNAILENHKRSPSNNDALHVHCDEHNYLISQCIRVRGRCNAALVSISCSGSVSFNMSETCGGALKIKYQNKPEDVCHFNISNDLKNKLCQDLNCGPFKGILQVKNQINGKTSLICSDSYKDPRYCVKEEKSCPNNRGDGLACQAYVQPTKPPPDPEPTNPVPIIVGVLILLILVALIVIFVRYRIKRRYRKSMMPPDMEEADWDSGEYEDVNKSDETGSFNRGRFRSESDFQGERDVESNRSYNYDDIDEVTEAQPLTPQGSMVRAAKDEDTQEGVINRSDDGVTYEVDDLQENYDDIDASPEKEETTVEVHDGPKPALEDDAATLKDQVQKDEDYLVPAQDG